MGDQSSRLPVQFTVFTDTDGDYVSFQLAGEDTHFNISTRPQNDGTLKTRKIQNDSDASRWDVYVQYASSWAESVHLMIDTASGQLKFTEQRAFSPVKTTRINATCEPFTYPSH